MEISITLRTYSTKLQSFSKYWCNFHIDRSDQEKVGKTPIENARCGPEKTTLIFCFKQCCCYKPVG